MLLRYYFNFPSTSSRAVRARGLCPLQIPQVRGNSDCVADLTRACLRQRACAIYHAPGNEAACQRQRVEGEQSGAAAEPEQRVGVGKQSDQAVGELDAGAAVQRARAAIAVDKTVAAGLARIAREAGEFPRVAQTEVESLPGDRTDARSMQGLCDRPHHSARLRRRGGPGQYAMANHCRGQSKKQVGAYRLPPGPKTGPAIGEFGHGGFSPERTCDADRSYSTAG